MRIVIQTIPHKDQRYPTTGDWQFDDDGDLLVAVSGMGDWRYEALVGIHEAIEAVLCKNAGVREDNVTNFDIRFEKARGNSWLREKYVKDGTPTTKAIGLALTADIDAEPGDCAAAPYYKQHQLATAVERMLAVELGVSWNLYEQTNLALYESQSSTHRPDPQG